MGLLGLKRFPYPQVAPSGGLHAIYIRPKLQGFVAMWLYITVHFHDGFRLFQNHLCIWIPSMALNLPHSIRVRINITWNPDISDYDINVSSNIREGISHWPDDVIEDA
jgi:hypothetical protein